jgi:hypothetical protein
MAAAEDVGNADANSSPVKSDCWRERNDDQWKGVVDAWCGRFKTESPTGGVLNRFRRFGPGPPLPCHAEFGGLNGLALRGPAYEPTRNANR